MSSGIFIRAKLHQSINSSKKLLRLFNDIHFYSQNPPSIVAHTSNSSWFKFVKSICNHSMFQFQVVQCFQMVQCFSGSLLQCSKLGKFLKHIYLFINHYLHLHESKTVFFTLGFWS